MIDYRDRALIVQLLIQLDALQKEIEKASQIYDEAATPALRQQAMMGAMVNLNNHLRKLPGFKGKMAVLDDLAHALADLTIGKNPKILENKVAGRGGRSLSIRDESDLRIKAVVFTEILIAAKFPEKVAVKKVSAWLSEAGFVGTRKKNPIVLSTIRYWRSTLNSGDNLEDRATASEWVNEFTGVSGNFFGHWPPEGDAEREAVADVLRKSVGTPSRSI